MDELMVGRVTHYFPRVEAAAVEVTAEELRVGDTIRVLGATSNFTQQIHSMEMDNAPVESARLGERIGIQLAERARVGDLVFRIRPHAKPGPEPAVESS